MFNIRKVVTDDVIIVFLFINLIGALNFMVSVRKGYWFQIIIILWEFICIVFLVWRLSKKKFDKKKIINKLGIKKLRGKDAIYSIIFLFLIVGVFISGVPSMIASHFPQFNPNFPTYNGGAGFWYVILIVLAIVAGTVEELIYRGFVINSILPKVVPAILLSAFLFSLAHWHLGTIGIFSALVFGLFLGIQYYFTRNSMSTAITHILYNILVFFPFLMHV